MDTTDPAGGVAARATPRSAGHAAFALASFILLDLLAEGVVAPERARLLVGRAAAWTDRDDPAAAALLDGLHRRLGLR